MAAVAYLSWGLLGLDGSWNFIAHHSITPPSIILGLVGQRNPSTPIAALIE
jgi:hypothetical protein